MRRGRVCEKLTITDTPFAAALKRPALSQRSRSIAALSKNRRSRSCCWSAYRAGETVHLLGGSGWGGTVTVKSALCNRRIDTLRQHLRTLLKLLLGNSSHAPDDEHSGWRAGQWLIALFTGGAIPSH